MNHALHPIPLRPPYARRILSLGAVALFMAVLHLPATAGDAPAGNQLLPAFPGAEGFGMFSRGGRGGKVYVVTNLQGRGPGSLRAAVEAEGPRIVVFGVGGTIDLGGPLTIRHPYCTIAGQTAPGDGITLKNGSLIVQTNHVIVRYIRCRLGEQAGPPGEVDAVSIYCPLDKENPDRPVASDIILDHVSASWGTDETLSITGSVDNVTVQWSIVSEGLLPHSCGSLLRPSVPCHITFHHNLYANNRTRNPFACSYRDQANHCDWRNNVVYNGGDGHGGTNWHKLYPDLWDAENVGRLRLNCVNNYWICGPQGAGVIYRGGDQATIFQSGNLFDAANNGVFDGVDKGWAVFANYHEKAQFTRTAEEFPFPRVTTDPAEVALGRVLDEAGTSQPQRDAVDRRVIQEVRTGQGKVIRAVAEVGGWPELASGTAPVDGDQDGMPDAWEKTHGLNPADADDSRLDLDHDGYTNVEEYLNRTDPSKG
jgi:pectate lyase